MKCRVNARKPYFHFFSLFHDNFICFNLKKTGFSKEIYFPFNSVEIGALQMYGECCFIFSQSAKFRPKKTWRTAGIQTSNPV